MSIVLASKVECRFTVLFGFTLLNLTFAHGVPGLDKNISLE